MEKNKIIIMALIVIIAALLIVIASMIMPNMNKMETSVTYKGTAILNESDSINLKLTDESGTPLSNQTINITITDKDKSNSYYSVVTNEKGIGKLKLDKSAGKYTVTMNYGGNGNYMACNATKKITIQEKGAETKSSSHSIYAYKSDGTPMYSQEEVSNYVKSKYGAVNYHIQDNGYINLDDPGFTDDGARVVPGGVSKGGKTYERSFYENYIM